VISDPQSEKEGRQSFTKKIEKRESTASDRDGGFYKKK